MIKELSEQEFIGTFGDGMKNVTGEEGTVMNIWPRILELANKGIIDEEVWKNNLVEYIYRNEAEKIDHVLLPTPVKNCFVVVLVDLNNEKIIGYYRLDLNREYGLIK
jgi:hypothetical protein